MFLVPFWSTWFRQKQLLSSPTISHDDEDQQSDGVVIAKEDEEEEDEKDSDGSEVEEEDGDGDDEATEEEEEKQQKVTTHDEAKKEEEVFAAPPIVAVVEKPPVVVYQNRDALDLGYNLIGAKPFVQFTVLPENNVNCFFQNRAQYWRLSNAERQVYSLEKCDCCDFTYPSTQQHSQGPMPSAKNNNAITDSLKTFLKSNEPMTAMPNKRPINNNAQYGGFPMQQQQQQPTYPPQQYQSHNNGFYNNSNNYNATFNQQFMNNGSGFGTTLALLNIMNNATRTATSAFQAMSSNNSNPNRFFNNMNNGYGLYKQF